jgi:outer membrane immunogenic protein
MRTNLFAAWHSCYSQRRIGLLRFGSKILSPRAMKTILAGAAVAALIAVPALAADMPVKAPSAPPAPAWTWGGFYFGGNVGGGWSDHSVPLYGDGGAGNDLLSRAFDGTLNFNAVPRSQSIRSSGVIGGGQIGYNWQAAPMWVVGLETDIQGSGIRGSATTTPPPGTVPGGLTSNQRLDWFGTLRGRLGIVASDRVLLFVTGGLAYGETEANSALTSNRLSIGATTIACTAAFPSPCLAGQETRTSAGWTAGAGGEWAVTDKWRLKVEYLHVALGDETIALVPQPPATGNGFVTAHFNNQFDIVRAGFNVRY